jgi:hypothetical protein
VRERKEIKDDFEAEKREMIQIYKKVGLENDVAH